MGFSKKFSFYPKTNSQEILNLNNSQCSAQERFRLARSQSWNQEEEGPNKILRVNVATLSVVHENC